MSVDATELTGPPPDGGSTGISIDDDVRLRTSGPVAATDPNSNQVVDDQTEDRPAWLPARYASPEQFARAYSEAERKITELAGERNQLREELEAAQQFQQSLVEPYETDEYDPAFEAFQAARQFQAANALRAVDMATREGVTAEALRRVPGLAEQLAAQAAEPQIAAQRSEEVRAILNQAAPDWQAYYPHVAEAITRENLLPEGADAQTIAGTVIDLTNRLRSQEHMKISAQTAVGSGTRPLPVGDDAAQWDAIKGAGTNSYADRMRGK